MSWLRTLCLSLVCNAHKNVHNTRIDRIWRSKCYSIWLLLITSNHQWSSPLTTKHHYRWRLLVSASYYINLFGYRRTGPLQGCQNGPTTLLSKTSKHQTLVQCLKSGHLRRAPLVLLFIICKISMGSFYMHWYCTSRYNHILRSKYSCIIDGRGCLVSALSI